MKKIYLIFSLILIITLAGCSANNNGDENPNIDITLWPQPQTISFLYQNSVYEFTYYETNSMNAYIATDLTDNMREDNVVLINSFDEEDAAKEFLKRNDILEQNIIIVR